MIKAIFVSFFNSNNIGDILITEMLTQDISKLQVDVLKCSYEGNFLITRSSSRNKNKSKLTKFKNKVSSKIKKIRFILDFNRKIKGVDILILGGGNMIMDLDSSSDSAKHFERYVNIAKKHNKKVVVLSIGMGPFANESQRSNAMRALSKCDFVTYRDKKSYELGSSEEGNHYISADPVYFLPNNLTRNDTMKGNTVGVGVINPYLYGATQDKYINIRNGYISLVKALIDRGFDVSLFSTEAEDFRMIDEIYEELEDPRLSKNYISDSNELFELYNKTSIIIAARMHSLIIAFTQSIPIIGLSWQQKVNSMFDLIEEPESCFQIDDLSKDVKQILTLTHQKINRSNIDSSNLIIEKLRKKYEINNMLLKEIIVDIDRIREDKDYVQK